MTFYVFYNCNNEDCHLRVDEKLSSKLYVCTCIFVVDLVGAGSSDDVIGTLFVFKNLEIF